VALDRCHAQPAQVVKAQASAAAGLGGSAGLMVRHPPWLAHLGGWGSTTVARSAAAGTLPWFSAPASLCDGCAGALWATSS